MKTSALLVLLLSAAQDSAGLQRVLEAGALVVTMHAMLSAAGSWQYSSGVAMSLGQAKQQPVLSAQSITVPQDEAAADGVTSQAALSEITACQPLIKACQALLHLLVPEGERNLRSMISQTLQLGAVSMAHALGTCNWKPTEQKSASLRSPAAKARTWLRRQASPFTPATFSFVLRGFADTLIEPSVDMHDMVHLADTIRQHRQIACNMMDSTEAEGAEVVARLVLYLMHQDSPFEQAALQTQGERDILVRC